MEKKVGCDAPDTEESKEICEIIETAIDEVQLLTRAFELIKAVCETPEQEWVGTAETPPEYLIN